MIYETLTNNPEETVQLGEKLGAVLQGGDVIAFRGGLGAGKTTLTRGIVKGMGLPDEVCSPTFSIVNEYKGTNTLYHFDMYRIVDPESLESVGFYDYLDEHSVVAVEWSENIAEILPDGCIYIYIEDIGDDKRRILIEGDERFADFGD